MSAPNGACLFYKEGAVRCRFDASETVRDFTEAYFTEGPYIWAADEENYYIFRALYGDEVWRCGKQAFREQQRDDLGDPCFAYMGEKDGKPLFTDVVYGGCLLPDRSGRVVYCPDAPHIILPILVNGKNVVNIAQSDEGFDIWNGDASDGLAYYEEIVAELKITRKRNGIREETVFPLPHGVFHPGDVVDFPEWW